ncbi:MAG: type II toxin-antitoxin system HicA family toxin [Candidatus Altiarchaeota archaeon]
MKTPVVSWKDVVKALTKFGYAVRRQSGSHIILHKTNPTDSIPVPKHEELKTGTLLAIIRCTGLPKEEFLKLIK